MCWTFSDQCDTFVMLELVVTSLKTLARNGVRDNIRKTTQSLTVLGSLELTSDVT
jgi:hypothetical protein